MASAPFPDGATVQSGNETVASQTQESFETFGLNTAIYQGNQAAEALATYYNS